MEESHINVNTEVFKDSAVSEQMLAVTEKLKQLGASTPKWWDVGAAKYREMRRNGETSFPKPTMVDGISGEVPSRDAGRNIPVRIIKPDGDTKIKSVIMYIHGGGWVLMAEDLYDTLLKSLANGTDSLIVSVGYRLAPEDPWPAGPNDCNDVADWLITNAIKEYNAPFRFIGGDSAGGNLTMTTYLHLAQTHPSYTLGGLINFYGCYDLSRLPQTINYAGGAVMTPETVSHFLAAYCPGKSADELKIPAISPLYQDLRALKVTLPPAVFLCGTNDALLDDTAFMHVKWLMAGGEAVVRFYPGAPHGFMSFPSSVMPLQDEALKFTCAFVNGKHEILG